MDTEHILMPDKTKVNVNGKQYLIGKLSISQAFRLGQLITGKILLCQDKLEQFKSKAGGDTTNAQDLMNIISLLSDDSVTELFQIILKDSRINDIDIDVAIEIIAVVCECNRFEGVKKNVQRIMKAFTMKEKT